MMAGELNVEAMLRRLTAKQFRGWQLYYEIEPFGDFRADVRAAQIASMIYNMAVSVKDRKSITEFLLKWDEEATKPKKKQSWEEQLNIMKLLAVSYNAQTEARA